MQAALSENWHRFAYLGVVANEQARRKALAGSTPPRITPRLPPSGETLAQTVASHAETDAVGTLVETLRSRLSRRREHAAHPGRVKPPPGCVVDDVFFGEVSPKPLEPPWGFLNRKVNGWII